jgi:fumarate reductase (CoM/CoB) subunit A
MEIVCTDVLIIGGGLAAMMAALEASASSVLMVSKGKIGASGATLLAGANFAAVLPESVAEGDSIEYHIEDTLLGGGYINDPKLVRIMAENAPKDLLLLEELGIIFLKREGHYDLRKPPGHRYPRTVFTYNPGYLIKIRGKTVTEPLRQTILKKGIPCLEGVSILRLILQNGRFVGALGLNRKNGEIVAIECKAAVIASGGAGALYEINTNPNDLTGDSYSLALEAGCSLRDMEFVQFFPCFHLGHPHVVIATPILSDGAVLRNRGGERFLTRYEPERMESATRDTVSQAIYREIEEGRGVEGGVYLDLTSIPSELISFRFPDLLRIFQKHEIDLKKDWIRVAPAAHFFMGGVVIDEWCRTSIPGILAAGEATGGVHGANRLSGNGLTDPLVFGRIAGKEAMLWAKDQMRPSIPKETSSIEYLFGKKEISDEEIGEAKRKIRRLMWKKVGIIRNRVGLTQAIEELESLQRFIKEGKPVSTRGLCSYFEVRSMLISASAITHSTLFREESRGAHFREDFPKSKQEMAKSIYVKYDGKAMRLS